MPRAAGQEKKVIRTAWLLQFFDHMCDPGRVRTAYRCRAYPDPAQQQVAQAYIAQLDKAGAFKHPVVTQLTPLAGFYPAEAYHQDYATRHPTNPYIVYNDLPKVENLKRLFPDRYREQPVLVTASNRS